MITLTGFDVNNLVASFDEWKVKCPPKQGDKQWKEGRSALETARVWSESVPDEFYEALHNLGLNLNPILCLPEHKSHFDEYKGEPRNHDLLLLAEDENKKHVLIAIESKVDEPFGESLEQIMVATHKPGSNRINRVNDLCEALFGNPYSSAYSHIKYQLLTATAGLLADCKELKVSTGVFLVQVLVTKNIDVKKHDINKADYNNFIDAITKGKAQPIKVPGKNKIPGDVDLFIGKYEKSI